MLKSRRPQLKGGSDIVSTPVVASRSPLCLRRHAALVSSVVFTVIILVHIINVEDFIPQES